MIIPRNKGNYGSGLNMTGEFTQSIYITLLKKI